MATILTVDDRAINREFLATLLGYVGHTVIQAADGVEALQIVRAQRPDLIITDVLMPNMDGVELADRVHDDPSIASTPIIFYTASYRVPEASVLAQSCGVSTVLAKPAEPQAILDAVSAALGLGLAHVLMPEQTAAPPSFLGATLPLYMRDLTELQRRLRRMLNDAVEERTQEPGWSPDSIFLSYQTLSLRLAALLELGMVLSSKRDPQVLLDLFCSGAQGIMNCKYAFIAMLDSDGRRLQNWATRGLTDDCHARLASIDPRDGMFGEVLARGSPHRRHDQSGIETTLGLPEFHPPITSIVIVPLPLRSTAAVCGWICFADRIETDSFDAEDEQFAATLAAQLALAYGNLVMYDEIQQHAAKLEIEVVERRRAQNELAHRMTHDQTTGLPRFVLIEEFLQIALCEAALRGGGVFVYYLDLDLFHTVNETRGRVVADHVLRTVADRLGAMISSNDRMAHVAADEFAIVLVDANADLNPLEFGETLRTCIGEPVQDDDQKVYITCSVGVSCFPDNGNSPQELLRQAEAAMMHAKRGGRNSVRAFSNDQKEELDDRMALGPRLRDAIRDGQLILHYQPQVSGPHGRLLGFEALVRWQSPEFGLLPPRRFLQVAEEFGLIMDIGNYVLEAACRQARAWLDAGAGEFSISVNVSALHMQRASFVDDVGAALTRWQLPAHCIELELTENMMTENVERMIRTMRALKDLGVSLSLDDFGTGYSSLNYLRQFPIDTLKIDQSFVHHIVTDPGAASICCSIIALGRQLGMLVLAEGVETADQVEYLYRNGCSHYQGFYFSKPVTADRAFEFLQQRDIGVGTLMQTMASSG
jgi:diguanylate cyclase (GGDEF)-like protein